MRTTMVVLAILALGVGVDGCVGAKDKVTDGDRRLSHQNVGAARVILGVTDEPAIIVPAKDIEANAGQQLTNWGPPVAPVAYSVKASASARTQSVKEHSVGVWTAIGIGALTLVTGFFSRGGFGRLLGTVAPKLAGGPLGVATVTLVESLARLRRTARERPPGQRHVSEADIMAELSARQRDPAVQELLQTLARKAEKKLGVNFSGVLPNATTPAS